MRFWSSGLGVQGSVGLRFSLVSGSFLPFFSSGDFGVLRFRV